MHTWFHVQLDLKNLGRTLMCVSSIYVTAAAVPDHESSELDFEYHVHNVVDPGRNTSTPVRLVPEEVPSASGTIPPGDTWSDWPL